MAQQARGHRSTAAHITVATAQRLLYSLQLRVELMVTKQQLLSQAPAQSLRLPEPVSRKVPGEYNAVAVVSHPAELPMHDNQIRERCVVLHL